MCWNIFIPLKIPPDQTVIFYLILFGVHYAYTSCHIYQNIVQASKIICFKTFFRATGKLSIQM